LRSLSRDSRPRRSIGTWRALCGIAFSLLTLGVATGAGAWAVSPSPHAHTAQTVPDLTGKWSNRADKSGSPPWQLTSSNTLQTLNAKWSGGPGHSQLRGSFEGTLSQSGGVAVYSGPYKITEPPNPNTFAGTAYFTIENANQIKIDIGAEKLIFIRVAGTARPEVTPTSTPPTLGTPALYEAPAAGTDASYPLPKVAKNSRDLEGKIGFVDNQGNPVEGPDDLAVEAQAERAGILCYLFFESSSNKEMEQDRQAYDVALPMFATCVDAVSRVLARADQLKRQRGEGARASAAAHVCGLLVRGSHGARSALRVSCTATATGVKLDVRSRSSKHTLPRALGHHAPKLIVGRSAVSPGPAGLRLKVLWRAGR
jgi:hypothetical protein